MAKIGVFFSAEEFSAPRILELAPRAEQLGFEKAWISDHFHPWNDEQGESAFVWSVLGGLAAVTENLKFHTGVTCPTVRIHPAIIAQAAATTATMMPGRFGLGVGTGEALNEHIFGDEWPNAEVRRDMLEEAIEVIRLMWTARPSPSTAPTTTWRTPGSTPCPTSCRRSTSPRSAARGRDGRRDGDGFMTVGARGRSSCSSTATRAARAARTPR
jgi:alkanesulfonate monooxygenase SsuD/methylene tetrahydromethanopterin reductase-like flavin-dependent oxidoreductase (luciferase family)